MYHSGSKIVNQELVDGQKAHHLGSAAGRELQKILFALYHSEVESWLSSAPTPLEGAVGMQIGFGRGELSKLLAIEFGERCQLICLDDVPSIKAQTQKKVSSLDFHEAPFYPLDAPKGHQDWGCDFIFIGPMQTISVDWSVYTRFLKAGGKVFGMTLDFSRFQSFPYNHAFGRSTEIIRRQMELTLPGLALHEHISQCFKQAGLNHVDHSSTLPDFIASEYHSILSLFLEWRKEDILRSQHVTREEINSLLVELRQYEFQPDTLISQPGIHFIQASKPYESPI